MVAVGRPGDMGCVGFECVIKKACRMTNNTILLDELVYRLSLNRSVSVVGAVHFLL